MLKILKFLKFFYLLAPNLPWLWFLAASSRLLLALAVAAPVVEVTKFVTLQDLRAGASALTFAPDLSDRVRSCDGRRAILARFLALTLTVLWVEVLVLGAGQVSPPWIKKFKSQKKLKKVLPSF